MTENAVFTVCCMLMFSWFVFGLFGASACSLASCEFCLFHPFTTRTVTVLKHRLDQIPLMQSPSKDSVAYEKRNQTRKRGPAVSYLSNHISPWTFCFLEHNVYFHVFVSLLLLFSCLEIASWSPFFLLKPCFPFKIYHKALPKSLCQLLFHLVSNCCCLPSYFPR